MNLSGIVLSGGRGRRVGGADKGLLDWQNQTRVESVAQALQAQVDDLHISANRNLEQYRALGFAVTSDVLSGYQGPLAGIAACLPLCQHELAIVVPCDCPLLPADLALRLSEASTSGPDKVRYAFDGSRKQYLFAAIPVAALDSLRDYLGNGGRSVRGWYQDIGAVSVDFSDQGQLFENHNQLTGNP